MQPFLKGSLFQLYLGYIFMQAFGLRERRSCHFVCLLCQRAVSVCNVLYGGQLRCYAGYGRGLFFYGTCQFFGNLTVLFRYILNLTERGSRIIGSFQSFGSLRWNG